MFVKRIHQRNPQINRLRGGFLRPKNTPKKSPNELKNEGFLKKVKGHWNRFHFGVLSAGYYFHLWIRSLHDQTYQNVPVYKRYSDKTYTEYIHKTVLVSFLVSFLIFMLLEGAFPFIFNPAKPKVAQAGANSVTWTTKGDFDSGTSNNIVKTGADAGSDSSMSLEYEHNHRVKQIATGNDYAIGLKQDGTINRSGDCHESGGSIGAVGGWTNIKSVASGACHVIGMTSTGTVLGAGYNFAGQASGVSAWSNITSVASGGWHSIGLKNDGTVVAVGWNNSGQLNVGSWTGIKAVAGSNYATYGLTESGTVEMAGSGPDVSAWTNIKSISASNEFLVGLKSDGTVVSTSGSTEGWTEVSEVYADYTFDNGAHALKSDGTEYSYNLTNVASLGVGYGMKVVLYKDGTVEGGWHTSWGDIDTSGWTNIMQPSLVYQSPGTVTNLTINAGKRAAWSTISWDAEELPANTELKFRLRGSDTEEGLAQESWKGPDGTDGTYYTSSGASSNLEASVWSELEVRILSDGSDTPVLNSITISYDTLETPTNGNLTLSRINASASSYSLKDTLGNAMNAGEAGGYTNESSIKVAADNLTCNGCSIAPTNLRPEAEIKPIGTTFDGTGTNIADPGDGFVVVDSLSGGTSYHLRVRATDDQGRQSNWVSYGGNAEDVADFTVEQTNPTISSFVINDNAEYAKADTRIATVKGVFNDSGGSSGTLQVQFSQDGINWGAYSGSGTTNNISNDWGASTFKTITAGAGTQSISNAWYLEGVDGQKTIYVRVKDNAGNLTENSQNSDSIILDTQIPDAFSLSSPSDNTWQQSATPTLNWTESDDTNGISEYQLILDGNEQTPNRTNIQTNSTTPQGFTQGNHTWKIRAIDNAGNYQDSDQTWSLGFDAVAPSKALDPGFNMSASDSRTDDITITWNTYADDSGNGSPTTSYELERITYADYLSGSHTLTSNWSLAGSYTNLGVNTSPMVQTILSGDIQASLRYTYRIRVTDGANNVSNWLVSDNGLTDDNAKPDPGPRNPVAIACDGTVETCDAEDIDHNTNTKGYSIKLDWSPANDVGTGVTGYKIYRRATTDSLNQSDFTVVGYLDAQPGAPVTEYYDNDGSNDGTKTDTIDGELVTIKGPSTRLNDSTEYFYRITAIDESGNETDVIIPLGDNYASTSTPDVTNPNSPSDLIGAALGIDGQPVPEGTDPKQKIDVSWTAAIDLNNQTRIPIGNGSGIKQYSLYWAKSNGNSPAISDPQTISDWTLIASDISDTAYSHIQLDEMTWYYYKVIAEDKAGNPGLLSAPEYSLPIKTLSSQVPTTPTNVSIQAVKGNPNTNSDVGSKVNITFKSSYIRYSTNKITGFEIYRSTTNYNNEASWLGSTKVHEWTGLNITGLDVINEDIIAALPNFEFTDTVPNDAITYYYKVRALGFNPTNDPTNVSSGLSKITPGTLNAGWDSVPDATAPNLPTGLKVKDIHGDGVEYFRNIITWTRIETPLRGGQNDFKEYRLYRSNDGLTWTQILNGEGHNPLYNSNKDLALATNYYIDLIPMVEANQFYYYYVISVDDAGENYKYATQNQPIVNEYFNESIPTRNNEGNIVSVALNPAVTQPSIVSQPGGLKAGLSAVGVSTATVTWTTDQPCDSMVQFRKYGSNDTYKEIGNGDSSRSIGMVTSHSVDIFGLDPNTRYEYIVVSKNFLSNPVIAEGAQVPNLTTTGFNQTLGAVTTTTSTAEVKWTTNLDASSAFVEYQLQRQPGDEVQSGTAGVSLDDLSGNPRTHTVIIKGLRSNRTYTYKVKSISKDGYVTESAFLNFKTKSFDSAQFTIAPSSSNVAERNITSTTAQIIWETAIPTTSWIDYSLKSGVYDISSGNNDLTTTHVVLLTGLVPGNRYYYRVRVKDANEVEYTSKEYSLTAVTKPKVLNLRIKEISSYAVTIAWDTNIETETTMNWGKTRSYGEKHGSAGASLGHEVKIENLEDNTEYHYQIIAHDAEGNEIAGDDQIIRTPIDTEGPKITNVKTDIMPLGDSDTTAQVIVSWTTNKPATTKVEYDEGIIGGRYTKSSTEDASLNNSHTVIIKGLDVAATYHYRIMTKDKRGNTTISNDYTFVTPSKEQSIWQLIVKSLQETFAWTKNLGSFFKRRR